MMGYSSPTCHASAAKYVLKSGKNARGLTACQRPVAALEGRAGRDPPPNHAPSLGEECEADDEQCRDELGRRMDDVPLAGADLQDDIAYEAEGRDRWRSIGEGHGDGGQRRGAASVRSSHSISGSSRIIRPAT